MSPTNGAEIITCRAAVAWAPKKPLVIEEIQVEPPGKGEVRVKILYTSLCHSDVHYWDLEGPRALFPRILGHEASGVIESVGEGVENLQPGDHVLTLYTGECQQCKKCKSGTANLCSKLRLNPFRGVMQLDGRTRFSKDGVPIYHFLGTSTFSEYTVLDQGCVVKVDPAAPMEKICVLSCGVTGENAEGTFLFAYVLGLGAVWNTAKVKQGSSVAIFGLGTVGMAVAEAAKMAGATTIIGIDINSAKFKIANNFGITHSINPTECDKPVEQVIQEMTDGGVDFSFECVGDTDIMLSALQSCHDCGGMCTVLGVVTKPSNISIHPRLFLEGRILRGCMLGDFKPVTELPGLIKRYMQKEISVDKFITHELPFSSINEAFRLMLEGESLRCVLSVKESIT